MTLEKEDLDRRAALRHIQRAEKKMYRIQLALGHGVSGEGLLKAAKEPPLTPEDVRLCEEEKAWRVRTKDARMARMHKHCPVCGAETQLLHNDSTGQITRTCPNPCGWGGECNG